MRLASRLAHGRLRWFLGAGIVAVAGSLAGLLGGATIADSQQAALDERFDRAAALRANVVREGFAD